MKIEVGKYYRTGSGNKVGPMRLYNDGYWATAQGIGRWGPEGYCWYGIEGNKIVSEWRDEPARAGPIRDVTRRELVPGTYGRIRVTGTRKSRNEVTMDWYRGDVFMEAIPIVALNAAELREAAHLFNQLAEFLESER